MTTKEKIKFLKENIEPISDSVYGDGYRASAYLTDGTYIPCVKFLNPELNIKLAIKRFDEERKDKGIFKSNSGRGYKDIVETFVASGNQINEYDIDRIEISPFAFPKDILSQIHGETSMSWTGFVVKMTDGKLFGFGSLFLFDFFQMPKGYKSKDIKEIINHSYISKTGELKSHRESFSGQSTDYRTNEIYREKPFFDCYLKGL